MLIVTIRNSWNAVQADFAGSAIRISEMNIGLSKALCNWWEAVRQMTVTASFLVGEYKKKMWIQQCQDNSGSRSMKPR